MSVLPAFIDRPPSRPAFSDYYFHSSAADHYRSPSPTPTFMERDPVTGAPIVGGGQAGRPGYAQQAAYPAYPSPGYAPQFLPPYGYASPGYVPGPYLSPVAQPTVLPPSPQMVPTGWANAYNAAFGQPSPFMRPAELYNVSPQASPRRRSTILPSPNASPYQGLVNLPPLGDERRYSDMRENWADRFRNWIGGERVYDPHRQLSQQYRIHDVLNHRRSGIRWNVANPPHTIVMYEPPDPEESAFEPPLASCRIVSPLMPYIIEVKARSPHNYITIVSLLGDIYNFLRKSISRSKYEEVNGEFRALIDETYRRRCMSIPDEVATRYALEDGIKRVDFLLDKNSFAGLEQIDSLMNTFELKLMPSPNR